MGIQGLLPFLKPFTKKISIEEFRGKTLGVDAMCWMHRGAFSCSEELVRGIDTDRFVHFFLKMCELLRFNDIKPIIVFDGARLPAKAAEEAERMDRRERNRKEALLMFDRREQGTLSPDEEKKLRSHCDGAVKITAEMISRLMTALEELSINFCVSPFEADAQLAYLCRIGWVDAVISEDSDLLAYGCPSTIFKMDKYGNGENVVLPCLQIDATPRSPPKPEPEPVDDNEAEEAFVVPGSPQGQEDAEVEAIWSEMKAEADPSAGTMDADTITDAAESPEAKLSRGRGRGGRGRGGRGRGGKKSALSAPVGAEVGDEQLAEGVEEAGVVNLKDWTAEKFTEFCIFCGTDYNEFQGMNVKIKGFGLKTAFNLMRGFPSSERMLRSPLFKQKWQAKFPCALEEYMQRYFKVLSVFFHHIVFDPRHGCVPISKSFPNSHRSIACVVDIEELCGKGPAKEVAAAVYRGRIDARTLGPRPQEPLTPAERRTLDGIISRKRQDQHQYNFEQQLKADAAKAYHFEQQLKADAALIAAQQAAREAEAKASQGQVSATPFVQPLLTGSAGGPGFEFPPEDFLAEPREICLRPSDHKAIFQFFDEELARRDDVVDVDAEGVEWLETPPPKDTNVMHSSQQEASLKPLARSAAVLEPSKQPSSSNPFARKRVAPHSQASQHVTQTELDGQRFSKAARSLGPRLAIPQREVIARREVRTVATPCKEVESRQVAHTELGPRGGASAIDSAKVVLAQMGMPDLVPLAPSKDRGKLDGFFKLQRQELPQAAVPAQKSALADWKARPWEVEEEKPEDYSDMQTLSENPLSMKRFKRWGNAK